MGESFRNRCGGMVTHLKYLECLVECGQDEEKLGVRTNKLGGKKSEAHLIYHHLFEQDLQNQFLFSHEVL